MTRPRSQNLEAAAFVFVRKCKRFEAHVVYLDTASYYSGNPKWKHTATIDPAAWIEHFLNNPGSQKRQLEDLKGTAHE